MLAERGVAELGATERRVAEPMTDGAPHALLEWGAAVRRDLPWRRTRDPWAILVSEVMLQQTQVRRVIPKWEAFLGQWPTSNACADATLADVLDEWAGLGYPRRARNLWLTAQRVRDEFDGALPRDLVALLSLPGIGPYTARAVMAFAFEHDVAVVDTNIARVVARRAGRRLTRREAQAEADALLATGRSWAHNQSLMDLGALLCRPMPECDPCPLRPTCAWPAAGMPDPDPAEGSAGVSTRQSPFAGSDRQGRGRLVEALRSATVTIDDLPAAMGWPDDPARAERVAATLVADGLVELGDERYRLA